MNPDATTLTGETAQSAPCDRPAASERHDASWHRKSKPVQRCVSVTVPAPTADSIRLRPQKPRGFLRWSRYPRRLHSSRHASSSMAPKLRPRTLHNRTHPSLLTKSAEGTAPVLIALSDATAQR